MRPGWSLTCADRRQHGHDNLTCHRALRWVRQLRPHIISLAGPFTARATGEAVSPRATGLPTRTGTVKRRQVFHSNALGIVDLLLKRLQQLFFGDR
jgi:hypothetical protein